MGQLRIYTDGACSQNGTWKGGWACVLTMNNVFEAKKAGSQEETTNNEMELTAFREALSYIIKEGSPQDEHYIMTDSAYITNCFSQKWYVNWRANGWKTAKKEPVKNQWLWRDILDLYEGILSKGYFIEIVKVKGHSDNTYNNLADKLATEASK